MRLRLVARVVVLVFASGLAAQGVAEQLAAGSAKIEAKEWEAAAATLLALDPHAATATERQRLWELLMQVGPSLQAAGSFERAVLTYEAVLATLRLIHDGRDHSDTSAVHDHVAIALSLAGRLDEALEHFLAGLAMSKRLAGDRDDADVAASLSNVAGHLRSLGRAREALAHLEAALAMLQRLYPDRDHPGVATSLDNLGRCLMELGRADQALLRFEAALAMRQRIHGDRDHPEVAVSRHGVAYALQQEGRANEALPHFRAALTMAQRCHESRDHNDVAVISNGLGSCLFTLGRMEEALSQLEAALAMCRRLYGGRDHPELATMRNDVATCLHAQSRWTEALPHFEATLAMRRRLFGDRDHPDVAASTKSVASCLRALGFLDEALPRYEAALAMYTRVYATGDHPDVARSRAGLGLCLTDLGRLAEALPQFEAALASWTRLYGDRDHQDVATSRNNLAQCLLGLGRAGDALPQLEAVLAMGVRLFGEGGHPSVAMGLDNVGVCLSSLGRDGEALSRCEAALAMWQRLSGDRDHAAVATSLNNVAKCLVSLGREGEALPLFEAQLGMRKSLIGDRDHPSIALGLTNIADCLLSLGQADLARSQSEAALAMRTRLFGVRDHPDVAIGLQHLALCHEQLGRTDEALHLARQACGMIERLREGSRLSTQLRASLFDEMKRGGAYELLQELARAGDPALAFTSAERSRGRDLLDLMEQQRFDPLAEALLRVRQGGDPAIAARLEALRGELAGAELESDRLLHEMTQLVEMQLPQEEIESRRRELRARSDTSSLGLRKLLDERARLLADVLPVGRVREAAEIQAALRDGELLLEFTVTEGAALLYVLAREVAVEAVPLPLAHAAVQRYLPGLLVRSSHTQLRGRDPEETPAAPVDAWQPAHELFAALVPLAVWERIRGRKHVFVAAHRDLHLLPFELLVTGVKDGKPVYWLDTGPEIAYVPSGSALHWLRTRVADSAGAAELDLVAIGDPSTGAPKAVVPENGVFVVAVQPGGQGERIGLQPRDVLLRYDSKEVLDQAALGPLRQATEAAIADGSRADTPIPIEVWRAGETLQLEAQKGALGIQVAPSNPRLAFEGSLDVEEQTERILRHGDLERVRQLPRLAGAASEAKAISAAWLAKDKKVAVLLNDQATEPAVFELAAKAKYLHFACHGIAEEYAGQSLSMLVLSQTERLQDGNDGLLKLDDLLHRWRGRLEGCRLVVLSACRTNVGPTLRDEAPQALPLGFLFAGVPSVISTLWAVDDDSTRELMTDFYRRIAKGEPDKLAAFTAAKKALRQKYPDPFHWAPFLYMGSPE